MTLRDMVHIGCVAAILLGGGETIADGRELTHQAIAMSEPQRLQLVVGKSIVIDSPVPLTRVALAEPEIADAMVLSPRQVSVTGKTIGVTTLTVWKKDGSVFAVFDLSITPDVDRLKRQLHHVLPEEAGIQVIASHDHVTLAGTVSHANSVSQAMDLAEAFAPKKVKNLLRVGGVQQVMLEVRIAEMNRQLARRLGVNLSGVSADGQSFGVTTLKDLTTVTALSDSTISSLSGDAVAAGTAFHPFGFVASSAINALFRFQGAGTSWTTFVDALKEENLLKILAKPTLVALSGQEANFLAGGEFPFPVPQSFGVTTIKFKKFGVGLSFSPTIIGNKISIVVTPEVSELDFSNAFTTQGFVIPAISTRRAATVVELADGQSFAIAGLLQDTVRETIAKYPVLGDIPILGTLFRSSQFQKNETELVIIITPHLVKPLDAAAQSLPTDSYLEPNDFEFYLMGYLQGRRPKAWREHSIIPQQQSLTLPPAGGGLEGTFGHLAP